MNETTKKTNVNIHETKVRTSLTETHVIMQFEPPSYSFSQVMSEGFSLERKLRDLGATGFEPRPGVFSFYIVPSSDIVAMREVITEEIRKRHGDKLEIAFHF